MTSQKFDPTKIEEEVLTYWKENNISAKLKEQTAGKKKYYFLDGPPYMNMPPHVGHARTRAIRDPILKYKRMQGHDVRLQAGHDCHGLPIEVKVEEEIGSRNKDDIEAYGVDKFIAKCRERAERFVTVWSDFYERFGLHLWFDDPYMTMDNQFVESSWYFFKQAEKKDLLYKGARIVDWCPRCETPLSNYEAADNYKMVEDTSVYVKFPIVGKENEYILIWTTTPWTLPANMCVAVNKKFTYAKVQAGNEHMIMAKDLVETVMKLAEIEQYAIIEEFSGKDLEGLKYVHPLIEEVPVHKDFKGAHVHSVVFADYVTLEDGTGCVHTAPGHGADDYETGLKYKIPLFSPVDPKGKMTNEAGKYEGEHVKDANGFVIRDLHDHGLLLKETQIQHRYAHCWRCATPIITRTSPQWFIAVEKIRDKLVKENKKVQWVPAWAGEKRFNNWLEGVRDWCISRQRYWGTPLPIWECECGKYEVIGSLDELKKKTKVDDSIELHKPHIDNFSWKCSCGKEMKRVPDIADVWFDSGSTTWTTLNYPQDKEEFKRWFPVDFITEGLDQTRGWFYTLMVEGVICFDQAPYKTVLMNDFVQDKEGNKMSKSVGNVIDPHEVMDKYGADILRFYLISETQPWEQLKFNWDNVLITYKTANILWNSYQFAKMYMSLAKFDPKSKIGDKIEDKWILSRINTLTEEVTKDFESFDLFSMSKKISYFITEDLSRWYIKLIRNRTSDQSALAVLSYVLKRISRLMAPTMPFISESIYLDLESGLSIHGEEWPKADKKLIAKKLEKSMEGGKEIFEAVSRARQRAGIKLKYPLKTLYLPASVESVSDVLLELCNVKEIKLESPEVSVKANPQFSKLGPKFGLEAKKVVDLIEKEDPVELQKSLKKGKAKLGKYEILPEYLEFEEALPEHLVSEEVTSGKLYLDTSQDQELINESLVRELIRNIQELRKSNDYMVGEHIFLTLETDKITESILKSNEAVIMNGVSATQLKFGKLKRSLGKIEFGDKTIRADFRRE
ncbi:isoleucine--tRNA ligase [Candidatus Undinarchaeota archaeon]